MADEALEISINQVDYIAGSGCPTLYVFGRDKDGKSHTVEVNGFMPYFYVVPEDAARIDPKRAIPDLYTDFHTIKGLLVRKIYTKNPRDIRDIRDRYTHFEADINYGQRFLIDCGIYGGMKTSSLRPHFTQVQNSDILTPLRTCIIDIECNDERGFPEANKDEIICITCWDSFTDSYTSFIYKPYDAIQSIDQCVPPEPLESGCFKSQHHFIQNYHSEYEMMRGFVAFIQNLDPDVISGWNVDQFDMPYIQGRLQALKIPPEGLGRIYGRTSPDRIRGRLVFDLLMGYKKLQRAALESYRLDAVAEAELGEKKVRYTGTLCDLWKKTPDKLLEYNYKDVQLCVGINKKNHIIDFYREIARYVGCPLDRTLASSQVIDTYILRKANGTYVLPSRNEAATSEMFEGATVLTPSKGLRENVVVFDLKSLYPMIMMTINASLETKDPHGEIYAPDGTRFKKEPDGLTRSLLSDLLTQRDEKKRIRNTFPHGSEEYHLYDMQQEVLR
jgi:DNA polymerase I